MWCVCNASPGDLQRVEAPAGGGPAQAWRERGQGAADREGEEEAAQGRDWQDPRGEEEGEDRQSVTGWEDNNFDLLDDWNIWSNSCGTNP